MPTYLLANGFTYDEWADAAVNVALRDSYDKGLIDTKDWDSINRIYNYETSDAFEKVYQLGGLRIEVSYLAETSGTAVEVYTRQTAWVSESLATLEKVRY